MNDRRLYHLIAATALLFCLAHDARADLRLPSVIGSHMVLQRDKPLPIWGWAEPGEEVTVAFAGQSKSTKADRQGNWKVTLEPVQADGKSHEMTIKGETTITLKDVLIGEVWIGSGQSNMEWSLAATQKAKEAIAAAKHPNIRLFHVRSGIATPRALRDVPVVDRPVSWHACTPQTVPGFSGVLYYFGRKLHQDLDVPIGLINSSWGGSRIEPWTVTEKGSGGMYNAMISPLMPFAIRGVTWYQGESNVGEGVKYRDRMEALIKGWRKTWGKDMPFYFVQIAPWSRYGAGLLPPLWEGQTATLKIPHTGMAVTTDLVDDINDIHPQNKLDVGNRLALWALAKTYGKKDLACSGPLFKSMKIDEGRGKIVLSFAHTGGGLKSRDGKPLSEFEIAGEDGKFVPAEAVIDGDSVVVHAAGVEKPTQVRFGWRNTANPNLMNKDGLPASPFQTKDWQGGTAE
jgi:sialate O-acetylesterase